MSDHIDWLAVAEQSGLTPDQAARERARDDFEDAGAAVLTQFERLRRAVRRLREGDE